MIKWSTAGSTAHRKLKRYAVVLKMHLCGGQLGIGNPVVVDG